MVEAVGSFQRRNAGDVATGMSSNLEDVRMEEALIFSETIKVSSSFKLILPVLAFLLPSSLPCNFASFAPAFFATEPNAQMVNMAGSPVFAYLEQILLSMFHLQL